MKKNVKCFTRTSYYHTSVVPDTCFLGNGWQEKDGHRLKSLEETFSHGTPGMNSLRVV